MFFFKGRSVRFGFFAAQRDGLFIICFGIKRRIDIDEIDFAAKFLEQMRHDLEVVAPIDLVHPAVGIGAVRFLELCGIVARTCKRTFARPAQFGVASNRFALVEGEELFLFVGHGVFSWGG